MICIKSVSAVYSYIDAVYCLVCSIDSEDSSHFEILSTEAGLISIDSYKDAIDHFLFSSLSFRL